jgi:hypothetical protein
MTSPNANAGAPFPLVGGRVGDGGGDLFAFHSVMAGLVPATHEHRRTPMFIGSRHKAGNDDFGVLNSLDRSVR